MRNNGLVFFFMAVIVIFGFYSLPRLKKNEFPDVTIRTGVVAIVYPGATADEIEQMAMRCSRGGNFRVGKFKELGKKEMLDIYNLANQ